MYVSYHLSFLYSFLCCSNNQFSILRRSVIQIQTSSTAHREVAADTPTNQMMITLDMLTKFGLYLLELDAYCVLISII
jgi:hypothetical protein